MISQIIEANDKNILNEYLSSIYNLNSSDTLILGLDTPISIEEIRNLITWIYIQPSHQKLKLAILHQAQNLSTESANALLKILEEPPEYIQIILITNSASTLLPTINSRCLITNLKQTPNVNIELFQNFLTTKPYERHKLFPNNRENAIEFLQQLTLSAHQQLISNPQNSKLSNYLKKLLSTTKQLEHNTHLNLALDNLCLFEIDS